MITATSNETELYDTNSFTVTILPISADITEQTFGVFLSTSFSKNKTISMPCYAGSCNQTNYFENTIEISINKKIIDILNRNLSKLK
jgi:hypothetical protein